MITMIEQNDHHGDDRSKKEIEECVEFVRLELYNRALPCGPYEIRERLDTFYHVKPLPSERTIARILSRRCLTHNRKGFYQEDEIDGIFRIRS